MSVLPNKDCFSAGFAISPTDPALIYSSTGSYDEVATQGFAFASQTSSEGPRFSFASGSIPQISLEVSNRPIPGGSTDEGTFVLGVRHGNPYVSRHRFVGMSILQGAFYLRICPRLLFTYLRDKNYFLIKYLILLY